MHLNLSRPNILTDMRAAANGRDLRDKRQVATGMFALTAKRHLIPCKSYPYASKRQNTRTNRKMVRLAIKIDWDKERTIDLIERERKRQSLVWDIEGH